MRLERLLIGVAIFGACPGAYAQEENSKRPPATAARVEDEKAIAALVAKFTTAFNKGDAAAAAATFTEDALVVDETGGRAEGRAAIQGQLASLFEDEPGAKIAIKPTAMRFLSATTAFEEGRTTITPAAASEAPEVTKFTVVYVKVDGNWLQAAVRDEPARDLSPHDRLKELQWMVGEWVNESQDAVVDTTCKWSEDGNFLIREFTMKTQGRPVLSGTQRVGWDPLTRRFKTWIFDSEGGHGEGFFTRSGNQWMVKVEGVGNSGQASSATNIITRLGKDRMSWQSTERTLGASAAPGVDEFVVVRKPPEESK
ncbi:MAG: SgcJ/EcaC family oxidoreductase [Planctomycetota bacterium]|nr:SgcJ/EcaC family oxidoreductase [Planctomycetota bacterium]